MAFSMGSSISSRRRIFRGLVTPLPSGQVGAGALPVLPGAPRPRLRVTRVASLLPHLPVGLHGFRIVQLSDLHLEPFTKPRHIERAVAACNALRPDLVALTGDFVTNTARPAGLLAELLSKLEAPHGVFACLGNHDFWSDAAVVERALTGQGIGVLRNETRLLRTGRGDLSLAGLDSRYIGRPNLRSALVGWRPGRPLVMLQHEPDVADDLAEAGVAALQLSGHTHGGQLCLLGRPPHALRRARWGKKYLSGRYQVGSVQLYVNRGIGCVGVPLRVMCPPEITEVTLLSPEVIGSRQVGWAEPPVGGG
jgi:predicted MPP superfamily phosphohydrolase